MIYGKLYRFVRRLVRLLTLPYTVNWQEEPPQPAVYLCLHRNMRGPLTTLLWLPQQLRFWALSVYHTPAESRKHFAEYTFHERFRLPGPLAKLLAWPVGSFVAALCQSGRSIPVYRDSNAHRTLRESIQALQEGQNIILYPDIDYTNPEGGTELYGGLFYLERFYQRATNRHIPFIPLYIDTVEREIRAGAPLQFADGDLNAQKEDFFWRVSQALHGNMDPQEPAAEEEYWEMELL